jgi:uncharacterized protein YdaU (DUF1376 family)
MPTPTSKRTTPPAYQFYPGDFLKDENVLLMSFTEIGIYQVLLCHAWTNRGLPKDTADIAKMLKMPHQRFKKIWHEGALHNCFVAKGDRLVNPRQERERQKQDEFRRRQSDNAKKPRPNHSQASATAKPSHSQAEARALKTEDRSGSSALEKREGDDFDGQRAFMVLSTAYPEHRTSDTRMTQDVFHEQLDDNPPAHVAFARMMENLENHRLSDDWQRGVIPNLDKWLKDGKWKRRYEIRPASTAKTAGNYEAAQRFANRGRQAS